MSGVNKRDTGEGNRGKRADERKEPKSHVAPWER